MTVIVGYPGPEGSHSGAASSVLAPAGARTVGLPSFSAVVEAAVEAEVTLGVLPIENSLIGPIAETHDLLYGAGLSIVREATLPIRHNVLGLPGATLADATVVAIVASLSSLIRFEAIPSGQTAAGREMPERGERLVRSGQWCAGRAPTRHHRRAPACRAREGPRRTPSGP